MKGYPHNNPEIEGSMAMYPDPKPDRETYYIPYKSGKKGYNDAEHLNALREWQQSLIGYIKEVFKVGEEVWILELNTKWLIIEANSNGRYTLKNTGKSGFITSSTTLYQIESKEISHYRPGQKVDLKDFRWVEGKVLKGIFELDYDYNKNKTIPVYEWQPVEEPEEMIWTFTVTKGKTLNPKYISFQAKKKKGLVQLEEIKHS